MRPHEVLRLQEAFDRAIESAPGFDAFGTAGSRRLIPFVDADDVFWHCDGIRSRQLRSAKTAIYLDELRRGRWRSQDHSRESPPGFQHHPTPLGWTAQGRVPQDRARSASGDDVPGVVSVHPVREYFAGHLAVQAARSGQRPFLYSKEMMRKGVPAREKMAASLEELGVDNVRE